MKLNAVAYGAAAFAGLCMMAFLAFAAFMALSKLVAPVYAALLTAAVLLLAAILIPSTARWVTRVRSRRRNKGDRLLEGQRFAQSVEQVLESQSNPALTAWVRRHPDGAVAVTLALGIAAGYSHRARRVLQDLYREYTSAERERRSAEGG